MLLFQISAFWIDGESMNFYKDLTSTNETSQKSRDSIYSKQRKIISSSYSNCRLFGIQHQFKDDDNKITKTENKRPIEGSDGK
ncbi:hypothetical protein RclHR1_00400024 [Rhizophagus clarus]|uniref:Uncharacterized protein n=1 Tax=Rhizophagus clarus TaxID=94130 RepID=A0A2Z6RV80_9GLOM|nr:hypothetical protein RclHR1_00400024 [Rhizophagus clarus]